MNSTSIEWCNRPETRGPAGAKTWNPVRARIKGVEYDSRGRDANGTHVVGTFCTRISPGCANCYASTINKRFGNGLEFTVPNLEKIEFFIDERILEEPLKQKKPCTIFSGDMFDLFHEAIPFSLIAQVRDVIAEAYWHTFQLLTKRIERQLEFLRWLSGYRKWDAGQDGRTIEHWPANVWLGVSVEDQQRADERIPLLLQTPAAVRFLSVEPQLEEIDFRPESIDGMPTVHMLRGADWCDPPIPGIDWVICGGESGPGARPFNLAWAESLLEQCRAANVPFFMKQVGTRPCASKDSPSFSFNTLIFPKMRQDRMKGGDMEDWPKHLRVREFPTVDEVVTNL